MRVVVALLLLALTLAPFAEGQEDTVTATLSDTEYYWEAIDILEDGGAVGYWIEVDVERGPAINAFLLDEANFQAYEDLDFFDAYLGIQQFDTQHAELEHRFNRAGRYYLVVDNYDYTDDEYVLDVSTVAITTTLEFSQHPPRPVQAGEEFIRPDEWLYESWEVDDGVGTATVDVELEVRAGSPVNVYLLDATNFDRVQRGEPFAAYRGYQHTAVHSLHTTFEVADAGDFYILVDNADPQTGALPREGSIVVLSTSSKVADIPGPGIASVMLALVGLGLFLHRRAHA